VLELLDLELVLLHIFRDLVALGHFRDDVLVVFVDSVFLRLDVLLGLQHFLLLLRDGLR
jgi:hypothetical protein